MNDQPLTSAQRAEALQGMGCKRKRVEDIRFVQGKGNYVPFPDPLPETAEKTDPSGTRTEPKRNSTSSH